MTTMLPRRRPTVRARARRRANTGLAVGAALFLFTLVASYTVIRVNPAGVLPEAGSPSQIAPRSTDRAAPGSDQPSGPVSRGHDRHASTTSTRSTRQLATRPLRASSSSTSSPVAAAPSAGDSGAPTSSTPAGPPGGSPTTPHGPAAPPTPTSTPPPARTPAHQGPASTLLDPVVHGVGHTLDHATHGATSPLTHRVDATTDGLTITLDHLIGG